MPELGAAETGRSTCSRRVGAKRPISTRSGDRWQSGGTAQVAVFAGVPRHQAGRLLDGRWCCAGIVQADDGEGIDAALSGRERGADAGQQRMHGDRVDRHPAQHLSRAHTHLRKTPRISRSVSLS